MNGHCSRCQHCSQDGINDCTCGRDRAPFHRDVECQHGSGRRLAYCPRNNKENKFPKRQASNLRYLMDIALFERSMARDESEVAAFDQIVALLEDIMRNRANFV